MRESRSCFEQLVQLDQDQMASWMSCNLSGGRRASRAAESKRMPRYSRQVVSPSLLSSASGMPRAAQRNVRVWRWRAHWSELGAPTRKMSSRYIVVDWTDPLLDGYPLQGICQAVKDEGS